MIAIEFKGAVLAAGALLLLASFGCGAGASASAFDRNPDRDLSGLVKVPLLPADLHLLRRTSEVRTSWNVPLSAADAEQRIVQGARACWKGERTSSNSSGGALGELTKSKTARIVHVEPWPNLRAAAIGLGATTRSPTIGVNQHGFSVMFAIQSIDDDQSVVYAYRRIDNSIQRRLVELAPTWLAGETNNCDAR